MNKHVVALVVGLVALPCVAAAQDAGIKEGIYQAKTAFDEPLTVKIVKDKDGIIKIEYLGYDFKASLSVGKVFLKSQEPFGKVVNNKLVFQFPVMLSFSPSTSLTSESGGKLGIAYFKGEIAATDSERLSCVLTQAGALDDDDPGEFSMENIGLASPPEDAVLEKQYSLTLTPVKQE